MSDRGTSGRFPTAPARTVRIRRAREAGASFTEIADREGVSATRVRQLVKEQERREAKWRAWTLDDILASPSLRTQADHPDCPLSVRTANMLSRAGINTPEELRAASNDLISGSRRVANIGPLALTQIVAFLATEAKETG